MKFSDKSDACALTILRIAPFLCKMGWLGREKMGTAGGTFDEIAERQRAESGINRRAEK